MNNNQKIAFNSMIVFIRLCIVSIVSFFVTRVVLSELGESDFGLYNVVGGLVALFLIINSAMAGSTHRYIAVELGKKTEGNVNKIFNISSSIHVVFAFLILLLGSTIGNWYVLNVLNVDDGKLNDALFVFNLSIFTAAFSTLLVPYHGLLIACEKFVITASCEIISTLFRLIAVLFLLTNVENKLVVYATIMSTTTIINIIAYSIYTKVKFSSFVTIKIYKDINIYKEMISFAGWSTLGAFSANIKNQGTAMVVNYFFGTVVNAAIAVANQVNNIIIMFANSLNTAAVPQITKRMGGGNEHGSISLAARISKYTIFLLTIAAFPILIDLDFLLELWLKNVPQYSNLYSILVVLGALFCCVCEGTNSVVAATGKVKYFQIVSVIYNLMIFPAAIIAYICGAPAYTMPLIVCLFQFFRIFLNLYLLRRILQFDVVWFIKVSYLRMLYVILPLVFIYFLYEPSDLSIIGHALVLIISVIIVLLLVVTFGFDKPEKILIFDFFRYIYKHIKL